MPLKMVMHESGITITEDVILVGTTHGDVVNITGVTIGDNNEMKVATYIRNVNIVSDNTTLTIVNSVVLANAASTTFTVELPTRLLSNIMKASRSFLNV